nr:MAG TPA: distal tail protein [Caudoviricetes sp.]
MNENYNFLRTFTFGGKETNHLFQVAKLNIPFLTKDNEFYTVGNTDGKHFRSTRLGDYSLSIDGFVIKDNTGKSVSDSLDELKVLINSDEPQQLIFDIFPDRYFNAIFSGVQEYDATNLDYAPVTLVFDVPDALAHQINPSGFSNAISDTLNLVLDSEFNNTMKYMAPWVLKLDEKYSGSNIVRADFSNGTPIDEPVRNDHWLYKTWTLSRKPAGLTSDITVGQKVIARVLEKNPVPNLTITIDKFTEGDVYVKGTVGLDGRKSAVFFNGVQRRRAAVTNGKYSIYVGDLLLKAGDTFEVSGVAEDNTIGQKAITTVLEKNPIPNLAITIDKFIYGDTNVTGTAGTDATKVGIYINGVQKRVAAVSNGKYSINVADLGLKVGDTFEVAGLKGGTKIAISSHIRLNSVSDNNVYAGSIVLEEFTDGKKNNTNHFIRLPNATTDDFVQYSGVFEIENPKTNGIALSVGVYGEGTSLDLSKPLMAVSDTVPTYVASTESYGDVINVINNGTYKAYPQFEFTMNGENGLVAVLNENGNVLQFGNPEEVDGTVATRLDMGINEKFWGNTIPADLVMNTGFDSVVPNFNNNPTTPNLVDGSFDMQTYVDAIRPLFPQISQQVWHGPTMILPITAPSSNDRAGSFGAHTRFYFRNVNKGERGRLEFAVNDENGNNAMTFIVRDSSITNTEIVLEMWYKKKKLNQVSLDRKVFKKDFFEVNMERFGNTLTWRFVQINTLSKYDNVIVDKQFKFNWELEEDDKTKFTTAGVWFMRYGNTPHNPMYVTDMQVKWYNTPFFNNVKNIFQDGDNVTIDVQERSIYINGAINNELNIVGNEWEQFRVGLGSTVIQPVVSSWAEPANVNVSLRQSYL